MLRQRQLSPVGTPAVGTPAGGNALDFLPDFRQNATMNHPVHPITPADRPAVAAFLRAAWFDDIVVAHGVVYRPAQLPGFIVRDGPAIIGLLTYHLSGDGCEIVTIDSKRASVGIGTALIDAVAAAARAAGCRRLWLITTNDNLNALRFYQKRGFRLCALHPGAVERSREIKPSIPALGAEGIPLRDELELEMLL